MDEKTAARPGPMPPMGMGGPPGMEKITLPERDWDHMTLDWAQYRDKWEKSADGTYYSLKFVCYATRLLSREHQYMNLYVPSAYLHPDGTVDAHGVSNGYTARTAPIVMYNNCGGWMSSTPGGVNPDYIREGFVHVNVGARSRGLPDGAGKSPAACVDQKAAVRMLRLHDREIPGDKEKIISCGGSGGGQMSSILGATGNMEAYLPYLWEIGAAGVRKTPEGALVSTIRDDIFAAQCYCPIADIENADMAYAWQRYDDPNIRYSGFGIDGERELTPFQLALQNDLAAAYVDYLNSLNLKNQAGQALTLENTRRGSYYDQTLENISLALNRFLDANTRADGSIHFRVSRGPAGTQKYDFPSVEAYLASMADSADWLAGSRGAYRITSLPAFIRGTNLPRGKSVPGFDTFHCTAENDAFGDKTESGVHFSAGTSAVLEKNYDAYKDLPGFSACDADDYIAQGRREDLKRQTYLYNATHILLACAAGTEKADFAKHWRTRNGTADEHTSFAVAYNLCMAAKKAGADVDYALVWGAGHGDVDGEGTGSFTGWVRQICE